MAEIVYILTNPTIPDLVKIGRTINLEERIKSLYSQHTGVPVPFECFYACEVKDSKTVEGKIHDAFADQRVNPRREFFRISPERVKSALELVALKDITPREDVVEDEQERVVLNKERKRRERRENFNFSMLEIQKGEILYWLRDENITAKIVDDRKIDFEGEITSISAAAVQVLQRRGFTSKAASGSDYWAYKGETLYERRMRLEDGSAGE